MAALLLGLKVLGWVLVLLLALLVLVLLCPAWLRIVYSGGELSLRVGIACFSTSLSQLLEEEPEEKPAAPKPGAKKAGGAKRRKGGNPLARGLRSAKRHPGRTAAALGELASDAGRLGLWLLRHLHVRGVRLCLVVQEEDAAQTAIACGRTAAWAHGLRALLENRLDLRIAEFRVLPNFAGECTETEHFSCKITARVVIMVAAGIYLIVRLARSEAL